MATPDATVRVRNIRTAEYKEVRNRAEAVLDKYEELIWRQPNVHEFGVEAIEGEDGVYTGEVGITIYVTKKVQDVFLPLQDRIPATLEGIPVQIIEKPILRIDP